MSAKVVSLFDAREFSSPKKWTNQDVAEIYRVGASLSRAGLPIECEEGQTDEGDRWYAFCNANTGDVIVHFALIDDKYVAQVCHLSISFTGGTLSDIVDQFLTTYPVVLPDQKSANANRIWMHPASGLAAFVATLYFLLEMTKSVEAHAAEVASGIDVPAAEKQGSELPADFQKSTDPQQSAKQLARWVRLDNSGAQDGPRMVAITAAALIAGILMDSKCIPDAKLTFDPTSILEALNLQGLSDSLASVVDEVAAAADAQIAKFRAEITGNDKTEARTEYHAGKEHHADVSGDASADKIVVSLDDSNDSLIIDLGADLGVHDRHFDNHHGTHFDGLTPEGDPAADGEHKGGPGGGHVHTIAASEDDGPDGEQDLAPPDDHGGRPGDDGGEPSGDAAPLYVETVQDSSAIAVLQSLGLNTARPNEFDSLAKLFSDNELNPGHQDSSAAASSASTVSASSAHSAESVVTSSSDVLSSSSDVSGGGNPFDLASETPGHSPLSGPPDTHGSSGGSTPPAQKPANATMPDDLISSFMGTSHGSSQGNSVDPIVFANDFSIFDPVEVLRAFLDVVGDVGFAEIHDSYYLFDALTVATQPTSQLAFESVELLNGDEVNLIGQAATFDAVRDALVPDSS